MLISLQIENFALIDQLELEFGNGLNVLTGETGAGKSIILDAIDAALGGKVNSRAIRTGTNRALIEATFRLDKDLADWLITEEIELLDDNSLICGRELTVAQNSLRSRSRVNGVLVNRQQMAQLRDRLVEITAQGQAVQVGQAAQVREWLDLYGGASHFQQREVVATAYTEYQQIKNSLEKRRQSDRLRLQQIDLLTYQVKELEAASLSEPDELEQLEQERQRLSHVVELQQSSYKVYQVLYQNENDGQASADLLAEAEVTLTDMVQYDTQLQPILDLVGEALAAVTEAGRQIGAYGESLESDPQRLEIVESRIRELKLVCRKYGTLPEAIAYYQKIQTELAKLNDSEQSIEALEQQERKYLDRLLQECDRLTQLRQQAAAKLEAQILAELKPLAMEKVQFQVEIASTVPTATGNNQISFLFSPNPGEPLQPLIAIASGGEMSRFLLALKACFSQAEASETLIFDEIDVGVSGRVAQAIADKLHHLSQRHQVLCVTHQPLVAAMADRHFRVDKQVIVGAGLSDTPRDKQTIQTNPPVPESGVVGAGLSDTPENQRTISTNPPVQESGEIRTVVRVAALDNFDTRREELANLAGGKSAQDAIAFAESLLTQAANQRQTPQNGAVTKPRSVKSTKKR
ncbi:MAG: DNA repair protein RecN [Chroococcidiopsis sp. SAG 2025]|uniref:DNA repair protein RecN n=1 Tax=Chroococcidiopsis sp. SAG 2025 TaxID=171389 RepID=UPI0029373F58|nr:DNA repair protein RecN [Chroococcidiopsis sp. SAG 2025]MDV2996503.1 DNA repair protein RecN [Chroococcidiopsis sp. SAG 2025]